MTRRSKTKRKRKVYGPLLSHLKWQEDNGWNAKTTTKETYRALDDLFDELSILQNMTSKKGDTRYDLHIRLNRGKPEDEMSFEDAEEYYEIKTLKQYHDNFLKNWPSEHYWFLIRFFKREIDGKTYYLIFLNKRQIINLVKNSVDELEYDPYPMDYTDFISIFDGAIQQTLSMIKKGLYKDFLERNFDYRRRTGLIRLKEFWSLYPRIAKSHQKIYEGVDVDTFISSVEKADYNEAYATRFDSFTARKYYDICRIVFEAIGNKIDPEMTSKEVFYTFADGRTQGLKDIDEDSTEEFDQWYQENKHHFDHTFEIIRGRSFYRGDLDVCQDDAGQYYLGLIGSDFFTQVKIIKAFLALQKIDIVCYVYDAKLFVDRIRGESMLVINSEDSSNYGYSYVFGNYYLDATHLPRNEYKKAIPVVKWEKLDIAELRKE